MYQAGTTACSSKCETHAIRRVSPRCLASMTDCLAEQAMELEALEAILMGDIQGGTSACAIPNSLFTFVPILVDFKASAALEEPPPDGWPPESNCYRVTVRPDVSEGESASALSLLHTKILQIAASLSFKTCL